MTRESRPYAFIIVYMPSGRWIGILADFRG
jgi:hypothetical protein